MSRRNQEFNSRVFFKMLLTLGSSFPYPHASVRWKLSIHSPISSTNNKHLYSTCYEKVCEKHRWTITKTVAQWCMDPDYTGVWGDNSQVRGPGRRTVSRWVGGSCSKKKTVWRSREREAAPSRASLGRSCRFRQEPDLQAQIRILCYTLKMP